jgi:HD superfamily phosphohydrolase
LHPGHGPFSHAFDSVFIPKARPDLKWKHEDASMKLFDDLVTEYNIDIGENVELSSSDVDMVKNMISGDDSG